MTSEKKVLRVYLAGSFQKFGGWPDWRDYVIERCTKHAIEFYNPRSETDQGCIASFVAGDLAGVRSCDVVFCYLTGSGDIGASIECEHGRMNKKNIVLCADKSVTVVHPFLLGIARRFLIGPDTGIQYLKYLAKAGMEHEFDAIYAVMRKSSEQA